MTQPLDEKQVRELVDAVREERAVAESEILRILRYFEKRTGLCVRSVNLAHAQPISSRQTTVVAAQCDVDIGV